MVVPDGADLGCADYVVGDTEGAGKLGLGVRLALGKLVPDEVFLGCANGMVGDKVTESERLMGVVEQMALGKLIVPDGPYLGIGGALVGDKGTEGAGSLGVGNYLALGKLVPATVASLGIEEPMDRRKFGDAHGRGPRSATVFTPAARIWAARSAARLAAPRSSSARASCSPA